MRTVNNLTLSELIADIRNAFHDENYTCYPVGSTEITNELKPTFYFTLNINGVEYIFSYNSNQLQITSTLTGERSERSHQGENTLLMGIVEMVLSLEIEFLTHNTDPIKYSRSQLQVTDTSTHTTAYNSSIIAGGRSSLNHLATNILNQLYKNKFILDVDMPSSELIQTLDGGVLIFRCGGLCKIHFTVDGITLITPTETIKLTTRLVVTLDTIQLIGIVLISSYTTVYNGKEVE